MYTPIKLDKVRNFRYGMKAISLVEKTLKTKMSKINFDELGMEETATIMWAGLVHEDKDLSVDKVMDLIDEHSDIQSVLEKMSEAMNEAFGGNKKEKHS